MKPKILTFKVEMAQEGIIKGLRAAGYTVDDTESSNGILSLSVDLAQQESYAVSCVAVAAQYLEADFAKLYSNSSHLELKAELIEAIAHLEAVWKLIESVNGPDAPPF